MKPDKVEALIKDIAARHGIALGRDDPILILQTINARLLEDSAAAQEAMLDRFKAELEAIAHRCANRRSGELRELLVGAAAFEAARHPTTQGD